MVVATDMFIVQSLRQGCHFSSFAGMYHQSVSLSPGSGRKMATYVALQPPDWSGCSGAQLGQKQLLYFLRQPLTCKAKIEEVAL